MTHKLVHLNLVGGALAAALGLVACGSSDDGETTNASQTTTISTTDPTATTEPMDSSGGESTSASTTLTTTTTAEESSSGGGCAATDECQVDADCNGGTCIDCICVGGMDSSGGGECPPGEMCQMTGGGGMACLAEPDHCVLACGGAMMCPESMTCQNGACQYDVMMPPAMGDANYPLPQAAQPVCPDGYIAVSFGPGMGMYAVCAPACDGVGQMAPCPQAESGTAVGACLFNPESSGMMCMG